MKLLKNIFIPLTAILTISATIAAQAGAFEAKRTQIANCFIPTSSSLDYKIICGGTLYTITSQTNCNDPVIANAPGGHIFSILNDSNKITDDLVNQQCPGLNNVVCCIFVESDPNPCFLDVPAQPAFSLNGMPADEYRIVSIYCKHF